MSRAGSVNRSTIVRLGNVAWAAYRLGVFAAQRNDWMRSARAAEDRDHARLCVGSARDRNRDVVRQLRALRDLGALS